MEQDEDISIDACVVLDARAGILEREVSVRAVVSARRGTPLEQLHNELAD